jgi:beta-lactamase superfamily II metal-dependent hydrolase
VAQVPEVEGRPNTRPVFGGYALVAAVVAWLAGIALRAAGPPAALEPLVWGLLAACCLLLACALWLVVRRLALARGGPSAARYVLAAGFLACCLFLGATRAAAADPMREGAALAAMATGGEVRLRGDVAAEPNIRDGFRYVVVETIAASRDQGHTWQPVSGRVEASVVGPDDWFAPAYGDTVVLTGKLLPLEGSYAPAGVVARMSGARARIEARGGGNPVQAWLFDLRIRLAEALQRALPEPGAALPVGDTAVALAWGYYALLVVLRWGVPRLRRTATQPPAEAAPYPRAVGHAPLGRRAIAAILVLSLLGGCGAAVPALAAGRTAQLTFLDVGPGGEAALLQLPSDVAVLIDGGPSGPALEAALAGRLPFWQRTLDLAVLTDPRAGDARGLEDAARHFRIVRAADPGMLHPTAEYLAWRDAMGRAGAAYAQVRRGDTMVLDATTTLRVLAPPQQLYPPREGSTTASNDAILRLETPGLRALFLGSADAYALDALTGSGEDLRADVVELALVPGAQMDLTGPLGTVLARAHPRLIVVCDAPIPPNSATARRATAAVWDTDADVAAATGALIYRTCQAGTIELRGDASGWSLG